MWRGQQAPIRRWAMRFLELTAVAVVFRLLAAAVALAAWQGDPALAHWLPPADWLGWIGNIAAIAAGVILYLTFQATAIQVFQRVHQGTAGRR